MLKLEGQLAKARTDLTVAQQDRIAQDGTQALERPILFSENIDQKADPFRQAMLVAPFPLMIRRDDGQVLMVNQAWTELSGYRLQDIPTLEQWARQTYREREQQHLDLILNQGFSQMGSKRWDEYEITTRSGEKRIWDFSTSPMGRPGSGPLYSTPRM